MSESRDNIATLPDWPEGMRLEVAAMYLGISTASFEECVRAKRLPGPIEDLPVRVKVWSRRQLDAAWGRGKEGDPVHDRESRKAAHKQRREGRPARTG